MNIVQKKFYHYFHNESPVYLEANTLKFDEEVKNIYKLIILDTEVHFVERYSFKEGNTAHIGDNLKFYVCVFKVENPFLTFKLYNSASGEPTLRDVKIAFAKFYRENCYWKYERNLNEICKNSNN